jgi:hypothetical protein
MFFHVSKTAQTNFKHNYQTDHFVINLDDGWEQVQDYRGNLVWYKGYLDNADLSHFAVRISEETLLTHSGNFCIIKVTDSGLLIRTDNLRSFPIWYDYDLGLTNLREIGKLQYTDGIVGLTNNLELIHAAFDPIGPIDDSPVSIDQVVDQIDLILKSKVQQFIEYNRLPLRVFLSGGVDTALLFSYIKNYTDDYHIVTNGYIEHDYFYLKNHGYLSKFWAYNQIHYWAENCVLASGAPGDEFTARNPVTVDQLLQAHGSSFVKVMSEERFKNSLNYDFFKRSYVGKISNTPAQSATLAKAIKQCCEYNANDWQHWHLGKTLTWTPFRDMNIFKLVARLPLEDLKHQLMDSSIQIELIRRNSPELLSVLSSQKNAVNYMENVVGYLQKIKDL